MTTVDELAVSREEQEPMERCKDGKGVLHALLVEDNQVSSLALSRDLAKHRIVLTIAENLACARRCLQDVDCLIDAVLLHPVVSDGRGEDLLAEIEGLPKQPGVIIFSDHVDEVRPEAASYRVVWASKSMAAAALATIIRRSASGYAQNTLARFAKHFHLTRKEIKVLDHLANGASPKQIADDFGCSIQAIYAHLAKIGLRTKCASYQEVVAKLFQYSCHGLGHSLAQRE